ncbi:MAG: hypothetical protein JO282_08720 [Alphaproteobacteria bacterium]|nr:hypothetical protein [Alphaproteobacteria bacterium]
MITRHALRVIAVAGTCFGSVAACAPAGSHTPAPTAPAAINPGLPISCLPLTGEAGIGAGEVAGHNPYRGGRYTGLNTGGADFIGRFDLGCRDAWNSGGTGHFRAFGDNLVFQTSDGFANDITYSNSPTNPVSNSIANAGSLGLSFGQQGTSESGIDFHSIPYKGSRQ